MKKDKEVGNDPADKSEAAGEGQALQINENTIEDPQPPEVETADDNLQRRSDSPNRDQALQINENTIGDEN